MGGQWAISFSRPTATTVEVSAGMEKTHLSLRPGEQIRTPLILLLPWSGDGIDAHNVLRRHVPKYHAPQYDGKPVVLPISHVGWGVMKTATSLRLIEQITKENLGFENFHKVLERHSRVNFIGHAQTWWGNIDKHHTQATMKPADRVTRSG